MAATYNASAVAYYNEPAVAYYNEYDALKAEILREAIKAGAIAPGHVDERSICDVDRRDGCNRKDDGRTETHGEPGACGEVRGPGPLNGFWRDADWIGCRDGKFRPVEPGTFPLAHGVAARVGRLRLYGDAICVPAGKAFIEAYLDQDGCQGSGVRGQ